MEWTSSELKSRGWGNVRTYYWQAFFVSLICMVLGGGGSGGGSSASTGTRGLDYLKSMELSPVLIYKIMMLMVLLAMGGILLSIFVGSVILVGNNRYYMESRAWGEGRGIGRIFYGFRCGHYFNIVIILFLMNVKVILWSLLLVIPGIVKSFEYAMIPYILSEKPDISSSEAFALSKKMMRGNKWNMFLLGLSFIGWILLSIILATMVINLLIAFSWPLAIVGGILPVLLLVPYMEATYAEFYAVMRKPYIGGLLPGYGVELPQDLSEVEQADMGTATEYDR